MITIPCFCTPSTRTCLIPCVRGVCTYEHSSVHIKGSVVSDWPRNTTTPHEKIAHRARGCKQCMWRPDLGYLLVTVYVNILWSLETSHRRVVQLLGVYTTRAQLSWQHWLLRLIPHYLRPPTNLDISGGAYGLTKILPSITGKSLPQYICLHEGGMTNVTVPGTVCLPIKQYIVFLKAPAWK